MQDNIKLARWAGLFYLIIIVCAGFGEMGVRSNLIVPNNATETAQNIMASSWLFRVGFVGDVIAFLSDVVVAIIFYILFKSVSDILSLTSACFRLVGTAIYGVNLLNHFAVLFLLSGAAYLSAFTPDQLHALSLFFLNLHKLGYDLGLVFFGLHCLILGYLLYKSDLFPSALGILIVLAGLGYLTGSTVRFLFPDQAVTIEPIYIIPAIGELSLCIYLLVKGVKAQS